MTEVQSISTTELYELHEKGEKIQLVDVRTGEEYVSLRASLVTVHVPLDRFDPAELTVDSAQPVYFICRSGRRSFEAASLAAAYGFRHVFNVEGGTLDWEAEGLPVMGDSVK